MTKSEIITELLEMANEKEACNDRYDAKILYEATDMLKDCVTYEFHVRRLSMELNRRIKAEEKLELAQATNRQILENYVPKDDCHWHDVEKDFPTKSGMYLAISRSNNGGLCHAFAIFDVDGGWTYGSKVVYWMPLPEPPKEEDKND